MQERKLRRATRRRWNSSRRTPDLLRVERRVAVSPRVYNNVLVVSSKRRDKMRRRVWYVLLTITEIIGGWVNTLVFTFEEWLAGLF